MGEGRAVQKYSSDYFLFIQTIFSSHDFLKNFPISIKKKNRKDFFFDFDFFFLVTIVKRFRFFSLSRLKNDFDFFFSYDFAFDSISNFKNDFETISFFFFGHDFDFDSIEFFSTIF